MVATTAIVPTRKYGCGKMVIRGRGFWYDDDTDWFGVSCLSYRCGKKHSVPREYPNSYFLCERCLKRLGLIW